MNPKTSLLDTLPDFYKDQFKQLGTEVLTLVFKNREKALEYAKKGVEQTEPENLNDEYISKVADGMQALARIVLEERGASTDN